MEAIKEILERLQKFPQVQFKVEGNRITILPSNNDGFTVSLVDNSPDYTISFDGWHEEYDDIDKALNVFAFGLSEECRLRVSYRGRFAHAWTVEQKDEEGQWFFCEWIGCSETGLLIPPLFWLKKRTVYFQNDLIKSE